MLKALFFHIKDKVCSSVCYDALREKQMKKLTQKWDGCFLFCVLASV